MNPKNYTFYLLLSFLLIGFNSQAENLTETEPNDAVDDTGVQMVIEVPTTLNGMLSNSPSDFIDYWLIENGTEGEMMLDYTFTQNAQDVLVRVVEYVDAARTNILRNHDIVSGESLQLYSSLFYAITLINNENIPAFDYTVEIGGDIFSANPSSNSTMSIIPFLTADPTAPSSCFDQWSENDFPMQVIPIPPDTDCFFDLFEDELWLYPARLEIDVSHISNIKEINIDYEGFCGFDCPFMYLYANGNEIYSGNLQYTNSSNHSIDKIAIEAFEAAFYGVYIESLNNLVLAAGMIAGGDYESCTGIDVYSTFTEPTTVTSGTEITLFPGTTVENEFFATVDMEVCNSFTSSDGVVINRQSLSEESVFSTSNTSLFISENPIVNYSTANILLTQSQKTHLFVTDVNGNIIRTFWDGKQQPKGQYELTLNRSDYRSKGMYFLVLQTEDFIETQRFVVMN